MNFYFNSAKCCTFLLPILMMLFSVSTWAGNGIDFSTPSSSALKMPLKASPMLVTATITPTSATCGGATGSLAVSAINSNLIAANTPVRVQVVLFRGLAQVGAVQTFNVPPGALPLAGPVNFTGLTADAYTVRIVFIDPATGATLDNIDLPTTVGAVADVTPPVITLTGLANITVTANATTCLFVPTATIAAGAVTTNVGLSATDNCGITSATISGGAGLAIGGPFIVTLSVADAAGNVTTVPTVNVTVVAPLPTITCPANIALTAGACNAPVMVTFADPTVLACPLGGSFTLDWLPAAS